MPRTTVFSTPKSSRGLDQLNSHDRVVVEESARVFPICPDAANNSGHVNENLGPMLLEQSLDRVDAREIEFS